MYILYLKIHINHLKMIDIPLFIPESNDLKILYEDKINILLKKYKKSQINSAFDTLKNVLYKRYGSSYCIETFINDINTSYLESEIFSKNIILFFQEKYWSDNTCKTIFQVVKTLLKTIAISTNFINRLSFRDKSNTARYDTKIILKRKYQNMKDDHPVKKRLVEWIDIIRLKSKNKSPSSIKNILSFYTNTCLPKLDLQLEHWDISNLTITEDKVQIICINLQYFSWFKLFCDEILHINFPFNSEYIKLNNKRNFFNKDYQTGDKHVISATELENIFIETQSSSIFDQLMFLLLITTGMRVGGFINIRLEHICTIGDTINILDSGRTIEKGNKWFEFVINDSVKYLLKQWIIKERKSNSIFLFPSFVTKSGHMSDNTVRLRFSKLCKRAGVYGKHVHLHALRHSYAHILLNCGNDISIISKLLNHSNTQTTEKFYLKETASQVVDRANIPWLNSDNKPSDKIIPDFLKHDNSESRINLRKKERKIKRMNTITDIMSDIRK